VDDRDHSPRVDPEPLSTLIIALGAAGSVASLVSLIENRLRARGAERQANQAAIRDAILGAETSLNELRALVRSLEIAFVAGLDTREGRDVMNSLVRFGAANLLFTRSGYERWEEIGEDILRTAGRLQRHMSDLMRLFAGTNLRLPEHIAGHVQRMIEQVNEVMRNMGRVHFAEFFRSLEEVIGNCGDVMRELRMELHQWLR
jgi:hypothetical protein